MSQYVQGPTKSFAVSAAFAQFALVKLTSTAGQVALNTGSDTPVGSTCEQTFAAGDMTAVRLVNAQGTHKVIGAAAFAAGATLYAAAGGKVDDSGTVVVGQALEACGADGDIVEAVLY